jgi:hypothetical protein
MVGVSKDGVLPVMCFLLGKVALETLHMLLTDWLRLVETVLAFR